METRQSRGLMVAMGLLALLTVALLVTVLNRPAAAAAAPVPAPSAPGTPTAGVTVTGHAVVQGTPDTLRLDIGVNVTDNTVDAALTRANEAATKLQATLADQGVADKDIQSTGLSVQPQYDYQASTATIVGYQVGHSYQVLLRNVDAAGDVITAATTVSGDDVVVNGISFELEDNADLLADARERAVADASLRAQQYADAAGRSLGQIVSISESIASTPAPHFDEGRVAADTAAGSVPLAPGAQSVTVDVSVVFAFN
ncbi:MAG: SIMPL domain-containing protein [Actinomycetia bacterium]|nr:SIMPL domain-containing protein [Actinomycetes bacterium]